MELAGSRFGGGAASRPREDRRSPAVRVVERHGAAIMRTARRYSRTPDDAEDAYQRGVEILLTKGPDIPEPELVPWLKTVVKHEAFAIRRQRARTVLGTEDSFQGEADDHPGPADAAGPEEQTERREPGGRGASPSG